MNDLDRAPRPSGMCLVAAAAFVLAAVTAPLSAAGEVWIVDDGPYSADFTTIQAAVDAAGEGDTILVRPGRYDWFKVTGKSLVIASERPGDADVRISGLVTSPEISITGLATGQVVVLRGLRAYKNTPVSGSQDNGPLELEGNLGSVLLEDCELLSGIAPAGRALRVTDCAFVSAARTTFYGSVFAIGSELELYECEVRGSIVLDSIGAPGVSIEGGRALLSGSTLTGGMGANGSLTSNCTAKAGGPGLALMGSSPTVHRVDSVIESGPQGIDDDCPTFNTPPITIQTGTVFDSSGIARRGTATSFALVGELLRLSYLGEVGDFLFVYLSDTTLPLWLPTLDGSFFPGFPAPFLFLGRMGPDEVALELTVPTLPTGLEALPLYVQPLFVVSSGIGVLGPPSVLTLADLELVSNPTSDCNANGIDDTFDALVGNSLDENLDGTPDECQVAAILYVDDDAPGDPGPGDPLVSDPAEDGSAAHPFDSIQEAVNAATPDPYTRVLVADGTYTGPGNLAIDFGGVDLSLSSIGGASVCIIDCEKQDRGFRFSSGETNRARVTGFTIRNGKVDGDGGGAAWMDDSDPVFSACTFEDNRSQAYGGAIWARNSAFAVFDCTFADNVAVGRGGAIHVGDTGSTDGERPVIERCQFSGNTSDGGGAIDVDLAFERLEIRSSTFVQNGDLAAGGAGGAISGGDAVIESCVFLGNETSSVGGAIHLPFGHELLLRGSTFVGNASSSDGGALHLSTGTSVELESSILWGNSAGISGAGDQIAIGGQTKVTYSDVQGGEGAVALLLGADLDWAAGNFDLDPLFAGPADIHLTPGSPCIDTGDPTEVPRFLDRDFEGDDRRMGLRVDVGADETAGP